MAISPPPEATADANESRMRCCAPSCRIVLDMAWFTSACASLCCRSSAVCRRSRASSSEVASAAPVGLARALRRNRSSSDAGSADWMMRHPR
jgi:hypothetical protein